MDYKSLMGYSKEKVVKEQQKPQKESVVDDIKKELNEWTDTTFRDMPKRWSGASDKGLTEFEARGGKDTIKEVGASSEFKKYQKRIEKDLDSLIDSTAEMKILLNKMGGEREAKEFGSIMVTGISKIHNYMKTKFVRMVRKLI